MPRHNDQLHVPVHSMAVTGMVEPRKWGEGGGGGNSAAVAATHTRTTALGNAIQQDTYGAARGLATVGPLVMAPAILQRFATIASMRGL